MRFHNIKSVRPRPRPPVAVSRSGEVGVIDDFGREREPLPHPLRIGHHDQRGRLGQPGQIIATWDPHTHPS